MKKEYRSDIADILKNVRVGLFVGNAMPFFLSGMKIPFKLAFWLGCSIIIALIEATALSPLQAGEIRRYFR